jgi:plasmid stabilization system protein ParE
MAKREPTPQRVVIYSALANADFAEIHAHTAAMWGYDQAERYADLLEQTVGEIASGERRGKRIEGGHPEARAYFIK